MESGDVRCPNVPTTKGEPFGAHWHAFLSRPWAFKEHISALESRAALAGLQYTLSKPYAVRHTHISLIDNMTVVLALSKGRSSCPGLSAVCRRWAARLLACDGQAISRRIASEANPSDEPSRRFDGRSLVPRSPSTPIGSAPRCSGTLRQRTRGRERHLAQEHPVVRPELGKDLGEDRGRGAPQAPTGNRSATAAWASTCPSLQSGPPRRSNLRPANWGGKGRSGGGRRTLI